MIKKEQTEALALEFIAISKQFRLGSLPTELPHPKTLNLSLDAKTNLLEAIESIQGIEKFSID
jgi:hypothetical protein